MKVAFVSCTKSKESISCEARKMYQKSILFSKAVKYIEQKSYDNWYILSAKYGLLSKEQIISPYDITLNNMKLPERKAWAEQVLCQIQEKLQKEITQIDFYAGINYRKYLIPVLEQQGIVCNVPLLGKSIGKQMKFYTENTK